VERAAGVDDQCLAGHGVGSAHGHDLVGAIVFVGGDAQQRAGFAFFDRARRQIGGGACAFEQAGSYAVHQRVRRQRDGHALGEMDQPGFRDGVGDRRAGRSEAGHRGDVHDAARTLPW